jgi:hypothetical protein
VNARREPPPIVDDNPPTPPRQPPPEPAFVVDRVPPVNGDRGIPLTEQVVAGLVNMRRKPVDPMTDYVADGTRLLRFVKDAAAHEAALRGITVQQILTDALLGVRPLSPELLDAHYIDLYGEPRRGGHDD